MSRDDHRTLLRHTPPRPHGRAVWLLLAAVAMLALAGCGPEGKPTGQATQGGPSSTLSTTVPGKEGDIKRAEAAVTLIEVTVRDGEVVGPKNRWRVPQGRPYRIRVKTDVDDEVHVHGIDKVAGVTAGKTATIDGFAEVPGVHEFELHEAGLTLGHIVVTP